MIVHQILAGAGPHDAVTAQARAYRARFRAWGWGGADYATFLAPGIGDAVLPRARLAPGPEDVLVLHHSAVMPRLEELAALPQRRLLVYHNITPARWLWDVAPALAVQCAVGREQLPELVAGADVCAGVSRFNADELSAAGARDPLVIPLLLALDRLGPPPVARAAPATGATILFVGRLSPHKRQDEVIRAFSLFRRVRAPQARLVLVGEPITPGYGEYLQALAARLAPGAVSFEQGVSDAALGACYRRADALLCLSEHEGFCLPLIEALRFELPVVARAAAAVPETIGDAGLLAGDGDDHSVLSELLYLAVADPELRAELGRRGTARLAAYAPDAVAEKLRDAVERLVS